MDESTLRDDLARDRTVLANERTLLAYGRTALGLVALSVLIFRFTPTTTGIAIGVVSFITAIVVFLVGLRNYRLISTRLHAHHVHGQVGNEHFLDSDD